MDTHKRFYIDLAPEPYKVLIKLSEHLASKTGLKVGRADTIRHALAALAKKEKVS